MTNTTAKRKGHTMTIPPSNPANAPKGHTQHRTGGGKHLDRRTRRNRTRTRFNTE